MGKADEWRWGRVDTGNKINMGKERFAFYGRESSFALMPDLIVALSHGTLSQWEGAPEAIGF